MSGGGAGRGGWDLGLLLPLQAELRMSGCPLLRQHPLPLLRLWVLKWFKSEGEDRPNPQLPPFPSRLMHPHSPTQ